MTTRPESRVVGMPTAQHLSDQCRATDDRLAAVLASLQAIHSDLTYTLQRGRASDWREHYTPPAERSRLAERLIDWGCAIVLGGGLGWLAGSGF